MSTWAKVFDGLGYYPRFEVMETCEEVGALLEEEAERRRENQIEGLCTGKHRYW